jgi:hypothetical protein
MTRANNCQITIPCDQIAVSTYTALARDFSLEKELRKNISMLHSRDIAGFRQLVPKELGIVDPWRYKTYVQMQNLFKKYRFDRDLYSDDELEERTFSGYYENQVRLAAKQLEPRPVWLQAVLGRARSIARDLLGGITEDEILNGTRFGKKASIGCPLASAYIDMKLHVDGDAYTSTRRGYEWFKREVLPKDPMLNELLGAREPVIVESLTLQLVPKAWNKLRPITPLTLIDLYRSYGIGRLAEKRLARRIRLRNGESVPGLDIRRLPARHRRWVKRHSLELFLATADLSAASDSLVRWILNAVLPRDWYRAVRSTFFQTMEYKDRTLYAMSVLPMGNACTFPIETCVFYCLVRAVQELVGSSGTVSVFGDDLIYPVKLHKHIVRVFTALGLVLNQDKTYANYPFRESCGEDYYRGVAVRPAQLRESASKNLSGNALHSHIYKWVNVLLRRWDYSQIQGTIDMLLQMINNTGGDILRVPPQFPDQSGLKVEHPSLRLTAGKYAPTRIRFLHGSRMYDFQYLALTYRDRWVKAQLPYYWLTLSGGSDSLHSEWRPWWSEWMQEAPRETFRWLKVKRKPIKLPNGSLKKRPPRDQPVVRSRILKDVVLKQSIQDEEKPFEAAFSDWTAGLLD